MGTPFFHCFVQSGPLSPIVIKWTYGAPINGRKSMGFTGVNFHPYLQIPNAKWSIRKFHPWSFSKGPSHSTFSKWKNPSSVEMKRNPPFFLGFLGPRCMGFLQDFASECFKACVAGWWSGMIFFVVFRRFCMALRFFLKGGKQQKPICFGKYAQRLWWCLGVNWWW